MTPTPRLRRRRTVLGAVIVFAASLGTPQLGAVGDGPITTGASATQRAVRLNVAPAGQRALDVLATIPISNEQPAGYDRDLFPHWSPQDNGCDTRDRVLIDESLTSAQVSFPGCAVIAGDWYSTYDNQTGSDPTLLDVDHVVALREAWDSGAHSWTPARRQVFANDLSDRRTLAAVTSSSNAAKGARDPSNWIPSYAPAVCGYLAPRYGRCDKGSGSEMDLRRRTTTSP